MEEGTRVYVSGERDLAMDGEFKSIIRNKTPLTFLRVTKKGLAYLVDDNGKNYSVPQYNVNELYEF